MKNKCPKCSSVNIAEFLYGMPVNTPDLEDDLKDNKMILGGCVQRPESPDYHCNQCEYEWYTGEEKCKICLDVKMYCKCYEDVIDEIMDK